MSGQAGRRRRRAAAGASLELRWLSRVGAVPFACVIGALMLVAGSAIVWNTSPYFGRNGVQSAPTPQPSRVGVVPHRLRPAAQSIRLWPNRIEIPALHAVAPIVKVGTTPDDELDIPLNPRIVGWWSPGARPGAAKGTAVIAGHINYAGVTGALSAIGTLRPGERVLVYGHHHGVRREVAFRVTGVRTYHKTHLPYRQIFDQGVTGRLALVTCGGPFDAATGNYLDNIVAYAVATGRHVRPLLP